MTIRRPVAARHKLIEAVRQGQPLCCSNLSPEQLAHNDNERHVIAAEKIRDLLRGESVKNPDPRGVQVVGLVRTRSASSSGGGLRERAQPATETVTECVLVAKRGDAPNGAIFGNASPSAGEGSIRS